MALMKTVSIGTRLQSRSVKVLVSTIIQNSKSSAMNISKSNIDRNREVLAGYFLMTLTNSDLKNPKTLCKLSRIAT